ncbi:hypothetical protein ACFX2I_042006 [Malus domestica]
MAPKRGRGKAMEELIPPSPMRAKMGRSQARPSQQCGQSSSQPRLSRPSQHITLNQTQQQPPITRRTQSQLETQLQQNPSASSCGDEPLATPLNKTGENQSEGIRKGRGAALSISEWGTGTKVHIDFDSKWKPIKENATRFSGQLGIIARNGQRVPLTYVSWTEMPDHVLDDIWKEVTDNTDVPDAYKFHCLKVIGNRWRDWKCRVKQRWYDAYLTDEQRLSFTPPQVTTDQWKTLVKYWGLPNIKEYSEANKANRAHGGAPHRTGRTSFAQLKHEMREKGEKTDRLSMFIKTRTKKTKNDDRDLFDEESGHIINQFNQCLEEREEHEQDEDYRDEVFTRVMGPDAYGRVRMYGTGITPSQVFCQSSRSSNVNEDTIREEVERQYKTKIDDLKAKHESEIEDLRSKYSEVSSKLHLVMTHIGFHVNTSPSGSGQAPNTSSHLQETYGSNEQQPQLEPEP